MKLDQVTQAVSRIKWLDRQIEFLRDHAQDIRNEKGDDFVRDRYGNAVYVERFRFAGFLDEQRKAYETGRAVLAKQLNIED